MQLSPANITGKKILISPLDWGMGHTARCVALIRTLLSNSNQILFAGNDQQIEFIKREFPTIQTEFLEGYNITLDSKKSTYVQVFLQFKKLNRAIKSEQKFAEQIAEREKIDIIISDNRYGFRSSKAKNILLTHQLNLQIPKWKNFVNRKLKKQIEKFDLCWIPDSITKPICCELTKVELTIPKQLIGPLCRFEKIDTPIEYEILFIASGPEPERSRFAKKICDNLISKQKHFAVVGFMYDKIGADYFRNPSTSELEFLINSSQTIISRGGYTTIMEMIALQKNTILIPTKGQYEQEYLAKTICYPNIIFNSEHEFFTEDLV